MTTESTLKDRMAPDVLLKFFLHLNVHQNNQL